MLLILLATGLATKENVAKEGWTKQVRFRIGEHGPDIRAGVCRDLEELGIQLDDDANANASGEVRISAAESRTEVWIIPTNEELIVARQTKALIEAK